MAKRDLGSRVVVRQRLGAQFTDHLGELIELSDTYLTVSTRRGEIRIPVAEVHLAKRIPDPAGLELAAAEAVPATVIEKLGDWQLRAAQGFTGRANSALPLGDPGLPFPQAIDAVVDFYARHGLPAQIDVPLPIGRPVARRLEHLGWQPDCTVLVRVIDLPDLIAATPAGTEFELTEKPTGEMLALIQDRRGRLPESAMHVLTAVKDLAFAGYREEGALLSMARGTVTRRWLGLSFVATLDHARRRGLARRAVGALARWAAERGATRSFLQVQDDNTAALALYDSMGFTAHHRYTRYTRLG